MKMNLVVFTVVAALIKPGELGRIQRQANAASCNEGDVIQQGIFKYKCANGLPKFTSCIASQRAKNVEIQANETRTIDGFWYKCSEENGRARYSEESRCTIGDKSIHANETTIIGNLVFLCNPNGIQVTGCVFTDENGKLIQIKVGESALIGSTRHICGGLSGPNGTNLAGTGGGNRTSGTGSFPNDLNCLSDKGERKNNETWTARSFRYVCTGGEVKIVACVIDDKNELPVGQTVAKFGLLHHCIKEGNRVSYRSEICGVGNVQCGPFANPTATNTGGGPGSSQTSGNTGVGAGTGNGTQNSCIKDNQPHDIGSTWVANNFKYLCHNDGSVTIEACVTTSGREIGVGEVWVFSSQQHTCSPRPNGVAYSTQTCGIHVQCGPEGLQQGSPATTSLPRLP